MSYFMVASCPVQNQERSAGIFFIVGKRSEKYTSRTKLHTGKKDEFSNAVDNNRRICVAATTRQDMCMMWVSRPTTIDILYTSNTQNLEIYVSETSTAFPDTIQADPICVNLGSKTSRMTK